MTQQTNRLNTALAGRYRIERHLGEGGMASVYLCEDLKHDRKVALKLLKPELAAVLGADRFVVEIKTTAALQHPHILPLFDSGTADGFLFYVMPYIQGETLREKLNRETQLSVDEAVRIAREVLDALGYAHDHGIVHRDVKPENILLHGGHAMVADFGIALAVSAAAGGRMTETGLSLGTPHYMSPEQATAEKEITPRSDVYSLGSVLYEMLTGNPPFTGSAAQQIIMKIITEPAESVTKYRKSVPQNVAAAVAMALEKLPADRFANAKEFADALANASFATRATTGWNAGVAGGAGISSRAFTLTAALALLATGAAIWGWRRPEAPRAVTRVSVVLPDSQVLANGSLAFRIALSPDGRTLAYVGGEGGSAPTRLWVRRLDELRATPLAGTEGAINPAFSPDGKRIAFVSTLPTRVLKTIAVAGGPTTTLTDFAVDLAGVSWATDGYVYYDGKLPGDGLARVRETGGKPETASMPDSAHGELYHVSPSALPNGRGVIFTSARGGSLDQFDVAVLDTRTGKHKVLVNAVIGRYAPSGHLVYVTASGTMMAAPFDANRLRVTGEAAPILDGVAVRTVGRGDVALAANGTLMYAAGAASGGQRELTWITRDGKATPVDTQFRGSFTGRPTLSPDGRRVAVTRVYAGNVSTIWVKQLDHGPATKLVEGGFIPAWSSDGVAIIYAAPGAIMRVPADGSRMPAEVRRVGSSITSVSQTRDGKWIVYASLRGVFAASTADTTTLTLLEGTRFRRVAVSPDSRWIAYDSDESGRWEVYVRPFPDTKLARRQVSVTGGLNPRWSSDGRELFFSDESSGTLNAVPVSPGQSFVTGEMRRLFPQAGYTGNDVASDGRFVAIRAAGAAATRPDELILVENFTEELKAKVKPK